MPSSNEFVPLNIAVLTVSDTRTLVEDKSGNILEELLSGAGHKCAYRDLVKDDKDAIIGVLNRWIEDPIVDVVISTGGTGVTGRDVTPEAFKTLFEKEIPGFGELFRWLSFQSIGVSAIQSRAIAGLSKGTYLFALPGSTSACRDGWDLILKHQLDSRSKPCNFVDLLPRLQET